MIGILRETSLYTGRGNNANGFETRRIAGGMLELAMWGRFPPGWAGALSGGLSRKGISILKGSAKKTGNSWEAVFEMDTSKCVEDPVSLDFLALALDEGDTDLATGISLRGFCLRVQDIHGGALFLEVTADDQLGFLAALFNHLAFMFLFPDYMRIETVNGMARDGFRLKGIGGSAPSATVRDVLLRKLRNMVVK